MKRRKRKDNFIRSKVKNEKNKIKENGINFLKRKVTSKTQINSNQIKTKNRNQIGQKHLITLAIKVNSLLLQDPVRKKALHFHQSMNKFVDNLKERSV